MALTAMLVSTPMLSAVADLAGAVTGVSRVVAAAVALSVMDARSTTVSSDALSPGRPSFRKAVSASRASLNPESAEVAHSLVNHATHSVIGLDARQQGQGRVVR